jgi:hypothetical protein
MGIALADAAIDYGASVDLVLGPVNIIPQKSSVKVTNVTTAETMATECIARFDKCDIAILAAAVADFTPIRVYEEKIKNKDSELLLELKPTRDIAMTLGMQKRSSQILVGFALETDNELENAIEKLRKKNLDIIVLNSLKEEGAGFGHNTNKITLIDRDNNIDKFELKSKEAAAMDIGSIMAARFKFFLIAFLILLPGIIDAQELNCNIQISAQRIQGSNRQIFESMQRDLYDFMNNTVWTNHVFSYAERIDCNILINLSDQLSADEFKGTIQIQLSRPVFNTTYKSTMLNFIDNNFQFRYVEFQPLEFDPSTYRSSLVSVLAYYTYMILGFDYDSFSPLGGTEFFQMAEKIVTTAQNAPEPGWKPYDGSRNRNRYWLVKNVLDKEYEGVRLFIYDYNINGLDKMESKIAEARTSMVESLKLIQEVYRKKPDPFMYLVQVIMDAKSDELINIFTEAFPEEKSRVVQILTEIDPANKAKYEKINSANAQ